MPNQSQWILDEEQARAIRHALLIGLESFGEVERLADECGIADALGKDVPRKLRPLHPTGSNATIGSFAAALRYLDSTEVHHG